MPALMSHSATRMSSGVRQQQGLTPQRWGVNAGALSGGRGSAAPAASAMPSSVTQPFQRALDTLSGADSDVEKMFQAGKRRTMSNVAMQSVNAGMANTLNMPAAGIAYDQAVRPGTNVGVAQAKAGVLQNLGQTAAGIYGTNVGAATSRYGADVSAGTAMSGQSLQFTSNKANQALQKYIADLNSNTRLQIAGVGSGGSVPSNPGATRA